MISRACVDACSSVVGMVGISGGSDGCGSTYVTGVSGKKSSCTNSRPVTRLCDFSWARRPRSMSCCDDLGIAQCRAACRRRMIFDGSISTKTGMRQLVGRFFLAREHELDVGDRADLDALELHRRADAQAVHRAGEEQDERRRVAEELARAEHQRRRATASAIAPTHEGADHRRIGFLTHAASPPSPSSSPRRQEAAHRRDRRSGRAAPSGRPLRDHRPRLDVEEDAVVADGEDARQLVRDDDDRRAEAVAQLEDQVVEQARADRVEAGRRLVEEQDLGIERHGARQAGALLHAAADLRRDRSPRSPSARRAPA